MPFDAGTAKGKLDLDASGFTSALNSAKSSLGGFVSSAGKIGAGLALGGLAVATAGVAGLTAALFAGSKAQAEYERSVVGLSNVLEAQAVPGFKSVVAEMESLATTIQRTTGVADTAVLDLARTFTVLGISSRSLDPAIRATLDFSAAMGIDANTAAKGFAQTLQGQAGVLARYLPQLRTLTAEQLKAGAAFDVVRKATEGQAAALGETFTGRLARLRASFEDFLKVFGRAFNDAFGPLATQLQGVIDNITDRLSQPGVFDQLAEFARRAAEAVKSFALTAIEQIPSVIQGFVGIAQAILSIADAALAAKQFFTFGEEDAEIQRLRDNLSKVSENLGKISEKAESVKDDLDDTINPSASLAENAESIARAFGLAAINTDKAAAGTRRASEAITLAKNRTQSLVDLWKKTNDAAGDTAGTVGAVTAETREAADAADDLAEGFNSAASAAGAAAEASSLAARFAAQGADAFGRRAGGSTSLDFSDPFRALAQAQNAYSQLGRTHISAFAGATQLNAARAFADGVASYAQAAIDQAFSSFTGQVLQELSAAGVYNPADRNRIVRERIAEAQRFGILPPTQEVRAFY